MAAAAREMPAAMTRKDLADVFSVILMGASLLKDPHLPVVVRPVAGEEDFAAAVALREEYGRPGLRGPSRDARDAGALVLLATLDGVPVGTCRAMRGRDAVHPELTPHLPPGIDYLGIGKLAVVPDQRHFGITAAMAVSVLAEVARSGAGGLALDCIDQMVPYYARLGFRLLARDEMSFVPAANLLVLDDLGFPTLRVIEALVTALRPAATVAPAR